MPLEPELTTFFETLYYCLNTLLLTLESLPTGSTSLVR
jgi:hypothetical protein